MRYRFIYFFISACVLLPGIFSLIKFGLKSAIDFTGGTLLELKIEAKNKNPSVDEFKKIFSDEKIEVSQIQSSGERTYLLRLKELNKEQYAKIVVDLNSQYGKVTEVRFENVGPTLGRELLNKTYIAAIVAITAILLYVAYSFKNIRFGVSAVLALIHDLLVVVGIFSILGKTQGIEVDSLFVTAVLTTMSFSVHDTIVVFDRIREYQKKISGMSYESVINQALTETMGRSLNNSLTIFFMLLALFLLGGETTKWFVLALLIGTISGTYSSPFVATPILYIWHQLRDKKST